MSWKFAGWYGGGCFTDVAFDPSYAPRVYASSDVMGVFKSDNLGDWWMSKNKGLTNLNVRNIIAKKSAIYVITKGGNFKSTDQAESWKPTTETITLPPKSNYTLPGQTTVKWVSTPQGIYLGTNKDWSGRVYLSTDAKTWVLKNKLSPDKRWNPTRHWTSHDQRLTSLAVNPVNPKCLFRTDYWGMFRSDDAGETWKEKIKGAPNTVGSDIMVKSPHIYVATMDNGLLQGLEGVYKPLFPSKGYDVAIQGHVWRVGQFREKIIATSSPWNLDINQTIISTDTGFEIIREGLPSKRPKINTLWGQGYPRALAVTEEKIYLGIDGEEGGLFISTDGRSWRRNLSQPKSLRVYNGLCVVGPKILWGSVDKVPGIHLSEDDGMTWTTPNQPCYAIFDIKYSEGFYAGGDLAGACLFFSPDGKKWTLVKRFSSKGTVLAITPKDSKVMALSSVLWDRAAGGKIWLTRDGCVSWTDITGSLPNGSASAMAWDGDTLYVSLNSGGVWKYDG